MGLIGEPCHRIHDGSPSTGTALGFLHFSHHGIAAQMFFLWRHTLGSRKLEHGCRRIHAGVSSLFGLGLEASWRVVMFLLSAVYYTVTMLGILITSTSYSSRSMLRWASKSHLTPGNHLAYHAAAVDV